jgi:hypothetical protein
VNWREQPSAAICIAAVASLVVLQAAALWAMGHPPICTCGSIALWHGNPSGPETSQHLTDWYSFTHLLHGFGFYLLLRVLTPRLSFGSRLAMAIGLEAGWEVLENTPWLMERYRQGALARGYFGDSVVNSVSDTVAAGLGFVLARVLPAFASVAVVIALELFLLAMIRDNLTVNIIQLVHPTEAISRWQTRR